MQLPSSYDDTSSIERLTINTKGALQASLLWTYWLHNYLCLGMDWPAWLSNPNMKCCRRIWTRFANFTTTTLTKRSSIPSFRHCNSFPNGDGTSCTDFDLKQYFLSLSPENALVFHKSDSVQSILVMSAMNATSERSFNALSLYCVYTGRNSTWHSTARYGTSAVW